ncbi:MAG TPA: uL22 family ribosomal protein [Streptosporangiaceae bacterium]|nr:uL22 family ribosomal protein [Streptosporangiaceae bacterium]
MTQALAAELLAEDHQLRVRPAEAQAAISAVVGRTSVAARARLRFGPGRTCEPLGRLLDTAITRAERAGLDPAGLIVTSGVAQAGEDIVRVRRKAHGDADWIATPTSRVRIVLRPSGLAAAGAHVDEPGCESADVQPVSPAGATVTPGGFAADDRIKAIRESLYEVIDPDLGVNVVDLGFVRAVTIDDRTAVITMTLTSAACPLTKIMEDQVGPSLAAVFGIDNFRVDWQWVPAWRPADITPGGRDQLRAIGFTL